MGNANFLERIWSRREGSNLRPMLYESIALPTELRLHTEAEESAESQTCTGDAGLFRPALYYLSYLGRCLPQKFKTYKGRHLPHQLPHDLLDKLVRQFVFHKIFPEKVFAVLITSTPF